MLITSGHALAWALYDREHEGLPSIQTLIYKTCSFWNWVWPLPHLQWTSALHCMGFLISLHCSLCSLISCVLFFCWDIKVCELARQHTPAYTTISTYGQTLLPEDTHTFCTQTWNLFNSSSINMTDMPTVYPSRDYVTQAGFRLEIHHQSLHHWSWSIPSAGN